jgi:hypothetical protein
MALPTLKRLGSSPVAYIPGQTGGGGVHTLRGLRECERYYRCHAYDVPLWWVHDY